MPGPLWFLMLGTSLAGKVTVAELEGWIPELQASIEAESGLRFLVIPPIEITEPLEIPSLIEARGVHDLTEGQRARIASFADRSLALYVPAAQAIYVNQPGLTDLFGRMTEERGVLAPALRCIVAHELVHALLDQRIGFEETADFAVGAALNEGAAVLLSEQVCSHPLAVRLNRTEMAIDTLSSVDIRAIRPSSYGIGERFLRRVFDAWGWPAVWAAVGDPPEEERIVATVAPTVSAPWSDDGPIRAALAAYIGSETPLETRVLSASSWLGRLDAKAVEPKWLFGGDGGLIVEGRAGRVKTLLGVVHIEEVAMVRAWLANRERRFSRGAVFLPMGGFKYSWSGSGPAWGLIGRGFSANRRFLATISPPPAYPEFKRTAGCGGHHEECSYSETWGLTGNVFVGLVVQGLDPEPAFLDGTVRAVAAEYPSERLTPAGWGPLEWPEPSPTPTTISPAWLAQWMKLRLARGAPCAGGPRKWLDQVEPAWRAALEPTLSACKASP